MPDYSLVPVDHQPDFDDYSLVPVDHDPFAADDIIQPTRTQPASHPQTDAGFDQPPSAPQAPGSAPPESARSSYYHSMTAGADDFFRSIPRGIASGLNSAGSALARATQAEMGQDVDAPTPAQGMNILEKNVTGPLHRPESRAGKFGASAGEFLGNPASYVMPGSLPFKVGTAALAGLGSEAGGQLGEGTSLEGPLRFLGGVLGGLGAARVASASRVKPPTGAVEDVPAFATHEAIPGAATGHLPGSINASPEMRAAYSADPRSTWAFAPGGRDAIYAGGGGKGGVPTQPTIEMQGKYARPDGVVETNPGWTARPLVSSESSKASTVLPADHNLLNASEATRGYIDAQEASAWHKLWFGQGNSLFVPMPGKATPEQLLALERRGATAGLPDAADTGQGVTMTRFGSPPDDIGPALRKGELTADIKSIAGVDPQRVKVDEGFVNYVPEWQQGEGSGAATREALSRINVTPEVRAALNNNADIPRAALARLERDEEYSRLWGATRADIQNARKIIGEGTGWVDRLEAALKAGAILPAVGFAILGDHSGDHP